MASHPGTGRAARPGALRRFSAGATAVALAITFQFPAALVAPSIALAVGSEVSTTGTAVSAASGTFGGTFDDVATVSGLADDGGGGYVDPTGFVTFSYCYDPSSAPTVGSCTSGTQIGDPIELAGGASSADGVATATLTGWRPGLAGYYLLRAEYTGDTTYDVSADDGSATEAIALAAAATTTGTTVDPTTGTAADTFGDLATVTGAASDGTGGLVDPSGSVTFTYCWSPSATPVSCASGTQIGAPVALAGGVDTTDGIATAALTGWTPADGAGFYLLHAEYTGDTGYAGSEDDGTLEAFHAFGLTTTVTATNPTSGTFGDVFDDVATVTGAASDGTGGLLDPTGSVQFYACMDPGAFPTECTSGTAGATAIGSPVALESGADTADGIATATLDDWWAPAAGYYRLHAEYGGDVAYAGSGDDGTDETILVTAASTTTVTQTDPTTGIDEGLFDDVATVTGSASDGSGGIVDPTGFVTFSYCWDVATMPATCTSGIEIGAPIALVGGTAGDGIATATLDDWHPEAGAGYYRLHADYTGDTGYLDSADDGTNETLRVWGTVITTTVADPTTGGYGQLYSDAVHLVGDAPNGSGGIFDPTGWVRFYYCFDASGPVVSCDATIGTPITNVRVVVDDDPADGDATTGLSAWMPPRSGWYLLHAVYLGDTHYVPSFDDGTDEAIAAAYSTVTYTGDTVHSTLDGANVALNAAIDAPSGCLDSGTVTYVLRDMSGNTVGSPIVITLPTSLATTVALGSGLYEVTVTFAPDTEGCVGASDVGVVAVLNPADTSNGGGWYKPERTGYTWSGSPRVNFGYNVVKTSKTDKRTGVTTITYRGNLIWINKGQWRLTGGFVWTGTSGDFAPYGTFTCPGAFLGTLPSGYTGAKCGSFRGAGLLQSWNDVTGWTPDTMFTADGHVTFTASMYDGGQVKVCKTTGKKTACTAKDNADWFGIQIDPVPTTAIREAPPAILWGGSVKVN